MTPEEEAYALIAAAQRNDLDRLRDLVEHQGANVNAADIRGWTALHIASREGHLAIVQYVLGVSRAGIDATTAMYGEPPLYIASREGHLSVAGGTPLHVASENGHLSIVRCLGSGGANVNATWYGVTPLFFASNEGHLAVVQCLVDTFQANIDDSGFLAAAQKKFYTIVRYLVETRRANVDAGDRGGDTALHHACKNNDVAMVKFLVETGRANVEARNRERETPLLVAATCDFGDVVSYLVQAARADVAASCNEGYTSLHHACKNNSVKMVKFLVETGQANIEATTEATPTMCGETPLLVAADNNCYDVVSYLVQTTQVNVDACNIHEDTALHHACYNKNVSIIELLFDSDRANVEARNGSGETPLLVAAAGSPDFGGAVSYLVNFAEANVAASCNSGYTALHHACENDDVETVELLVETGRVDVEARDNDGKTPLLVAAAGRNHETDVVSYLVETAHVDVAARCNNGYTPLHFACAQNNLNMVVYLTKTNGVNVHALTNNGQSVLHVACGSREYTKDLYDLVVYLVQTCGVDVGVEDTMTANRRRLALHVASNHHQRNFFVILYLVQRYGM